MAVSVTSTIKSILAGQKKGEALGVDNVAGLLDDVKKQILAELAASPSGYSSYQMKQSLASIESYLGDFESAADRELGSGIASSFDAGAGLLQSALQAGGDSGVYFGMGHISTGLIDTLQEFAYGRIRSVSGDAYNRIKGELTLGILGQKTPQQVASDIAGSLESPGIFKTIAERAEVITGTEMGRAFSMATAKSIATAAETVPGLQGMWIHAGHPHAPRQVHLLMHGQVRDTGKPFYKAEDGTPVLYPRDPNAPIKEVIRCGCQLLPYMAAWGSQKDFAADFDSRQYDMWKNAA
jgi:hypothetical protein